MKKRRHTRQELLRASVYPGACWQATSLCFALFTIPLLLFSMDEGPVIWHGCFPMGEGLAVLYGGIIDIDIPYSVHTVSAAALFFLVSIVLCIAFVVWLGALMRPSPSNNPRWRLIHSPKRK